MIEFFRHEAMNQATVIAGFSEIIENLLVKRPGPVSQEFLTALRKVEILIRSFNQTLAVFREESMASETNGAGTGLPEDSGEILPYFSPVCRVHYGVLGDIARELSTITEAIRIEDIGSSVVGNRYQFIQEACSRLDALFTDPVSFVQRCGIERRMVDDLS